MAVGNAAKERVEAGELALGMRVRMARTADIANVSALAVVTIETPEAWRTRTRSSPSRESMACLSASVTIETPEAWRTWTRSPPSGESTACLSASTIH